MTLLTERGVQRAIACHTPLFALLLPAFLAAQTGASIPGRVIDSDGNPLGNATVEVIDTYWSAQTRADGGFELTLPPGEQRIRFSSIGYTSEEIAIVVGATTASDSIIVRLTPDAIAIRGISVEVARPLPLAQTVTRATVRQVPPLGEPDIYRAIVLLPGVSQPNDLKGRIHLAGGASDETGVHLDGHPLQEPFHLMGLFSAFNTAALERANVLIHHLPASMGGRLSGLIDLETRHAGENAEYEAVVSLLTSGVTASLPPNRAGVDVLASGRITYLDHLVAYVAPDAPRVGFREGLLRVGRSWGRAWRAEVLAFTTQDHFTDEDLAEARGYDPLTWGESLLGARLEGRAGPWSVSTRASFNRASIHLDERNVEPPSERANFVDSQRDWWSGSVHVAHTARVWKADAGAAFDHRLNRQAWVAEGLIDDIFSPETPTRYSGEQRLTAWSVFGGGSVELDRKWSAGVGARLWNVDGLFVAPRARLGFRANDSLELEVALNRRYQWDAQLEEPVEGSVSAPLFFLEEPRVADVAAASVQLRPRRLPLDARGTLQLQAFWKEYRQRPVLPELPPGESRETIGTAFPDFQRISGRSTGATISGRFAFESGALMQGSYTFQRVREDLSGRTYPTAWDAPHTLALFGSIPIGQRWMFNAVYHGHTGRASTPVVARIFEPIQDNFNQLTARYLRGERNSIRVPPYHRMDAGIRREGHLWGAELILALQVLNVFFRENAIDYDWQQYFGTLAGSGRSRAGRSGLPIVPTVGVEVKW